MIENGEVWRKTMELRFVKYEGKRQDRVMLQQLSVSENGERKWEDIEMVTQEVK